MFIQNRWHDKEGHYCTGKLKVSMKKSNLSMTSLFWCKCINTVERVLAEVSMPEQKTKEQEQLISVCADPH